MRACGSHRPEGVAFAAACRNTGAQPSPRSARGCRANLQRRRARALWCSAGAATLTSEQQRAEEYNKTMQKCVTLIQHGTKTPDNGFQKGWAHCPSCASPPVCACAAKLSGQCCAGRCPILSSTTQSWACTTTRWHLACFAALSYARPQTLSAWRVHPCLCLLWPLWPQGWLGNYSLLSYLLDKLLAFPVNEPSGLAAPTTNCFFYIMLSLKNQPALHLRKVLCGGNSAMCCPRRSCLYKEHANTGTLKRLVLGRSRGGRARSGEPAAGVRPGDMGRELRGPAVARGRAGRKPAEVLGAPWPERPCDVVPGFTC